MALFRSLLIAAAAGAACSMLLSGRGLGSPVEWAIASVIGYVSVYVAEKMLTHGEQNG